MAVSSLQVIDISRQPVHQIVYHEQADSGSPTQVQLVENLKAFVRKTKKLSGRKRKLHLFYQTLRSMVKKQIIEVQ